MIVKSNEGRSTKIDKKLLIIGPVPFNHGIGGVTIHVQRLLDYLDKIDFPYFFVDYKESAISLLKAICRADVVHLHVSNPLFQFLFVTLCKLLGKKLIVTIHGNYGRFNKWKNFLVRSAIRMASIPIVINEKSFSICKSFNKKTVLIPAFIPPQKEETLQKEILDLIDRLKGQGEKIVSTNAYNISYDKEGLDTYGIDFLVDFFKDSADKALIVSDPSGNYKKRFEGVKSDSVFFIDYPHSYYELLKHVEFFVRNTSTDGDALSVKEALYLGVPTLCTDVVDRPEGVSLFKYSDKNSFEAAINSPIKGMYHIENGAERIIELYKQLNNY